MIETDVRQCLPPVVKRVSVLLGAKEAFELFTHGISRWWPLATHSCAGVEAREVVVEPRVGGHVVEIASDGSRAPWGTVLEWEPPRRFAMTWHPKSDPARATRVEVSFSDEGDGCRVVLVHSGWEARGAQADSLRNGYDSGWTGVLERYSRAVAAL